jgi:polysaccharide biosynthesis/export protein
MVITDIAERTLPAPMSKISVSLRMVFILPLALAAAGNVTLAKAQTPSLIPQQQSGPLPNTQPAAGGRPFGGGAAPAAGGIVSAPPNLEKLPIEPGFLLQVSVFNEPQLSQEVRVAENGDINLSLAGHVHVQGMHETEAEEAIEAAYKKSEMLKSPQVAISIVQYISPKVAILGEVQAPGSYELISPTDLLTAITMAGGATVDAGNRIILRHAATHDEEVVKFAHSGDTSNLRRFTVSAGDTIVVNRAGIVYVLGAVNRPGGYVMQPDGSMNVIQALALALDTNYYASLSGIRIIRKTDDGLVSIPVNYKSIVEGKAFPKPLEPDDIVYIPNSKTKLTLGTTKQLAFQASNALIYTGVAR